MRKKCRLTGYLQKSNMAKYKYFELGEFIESAVAKKLGVDNTPSFEVVDHLNELASVLDPMRAAWGWPVFVSSGFRCSLLNKLIGGSPTSVHPLGYAADLQPEAGKFDEFCEFVVDWLKKTKTKFDQLLVESDKKSGAKWLHFGLYNLQGQQRGQIKVMEV